MIWGSWHRFLLHGIWVLVFSFSRPCWCSDPLYMWAAVSCKCHGPHLIADWTSFCRWVRQGTNQCYGTWGSNIWSVGSGCNQLRLVFNRVKGRCLDWRLLTRVVLRSGKGRDCRRIGGDFSSSRCFVGWFSRLFAISFWFRCPFQCSHSANLLFLMNGYCLTF